MDQIKTKIEIGGVTLESFQTSTAHGCKIFPHGCSRNIYREDMSIVPKGDETVVVGDPVFFIDSDDPGKLHKFTGMKYEGLVDRPKDVFEVLDEFVKKFDGCTVLFCVAENTCAIYGRKLHVIRNKDLLSVPIHTTHTTHENEWNKTRVCKVVCVKKTRKFELSYIHEHASEIIAEYTRIMNDEDRA